MKKGSFFFFLSVFIGLLSMINFSGCKKKDLDSGVDPNVPVPGQNVYPLSLGNGWSLIAQIAPTGIIDIMFRDEMNGYALPAAIPGWIYKTGDGGMEWSYVVLPKEYENQKFLNLSIADKNVYLVPNSGSYILKITSDTLFKRITFDQKIDDVQFINKDTGFSVGKSSLFWTTDGGNKWEKLFNANTPRTGYNALSFKNSRKGMVILDSLYSIDAKNKKITTLSFIPGNVFGSIQFIDENNVLVTSAEKLFKSTDGGLFFQPVIVFSQPHFSDLYMPSISKAFLGKDKEIMVSNDTGSTWLPSLIVNDRSIVELDFINENIGWACSYNGKIYKYKK